jgi:hypothetical protein
MSYATATRNWARLFEETAHRKFPSRIKDAVADSGRFADPAELPEFVTLLSAGLLVGEHADTAMLADLVQRTMTTMRDPSDRNASRHVQRATPMIRQVRPSRALSWSSSCAPEALREVGLAGRADPDQAGQDGLQASEYGVEGHSGARVFGSRRCKVRKP